MTNLPLGADAIRDALRSAWECGRSPAEWPQAETARLVGGKVRAAAVERTVVSAERDAIKWSCYGQFHLSSRPRPIDVIAWCLLAAAVIFAVYVRVRLREFPLERDEGEFAYAGQLLAARRSALQAGLQHETARHVHRLRGLDGRLRADDRGRSLGAAGGEPGDDCFALSPRRGSFSIRLGRSGGDLLCDRRPSIRACSAWPRTPRILSPFLAWPASGCSGAYLQSGRWLPLVGSGLLLGTAFLMKQQGVFLMVFGGAVVATHAVVGFVKALRGRGDAGRNWLLLATQAAAFCARGDTAVSARLPLAVAGGRVRQLLVLDLHVCARIRGGSPAGQSRGISSGMAAKALSAIQSELSRGCWRWRASPC